MRSTTLLIILLVLSALFCIQCASEAPPGGGPPDKTPPFLIGASLQSGATMVALDHDLEFIFSENINPDIVAKSVTIFPIVEGIAKISARGRYITISPVAFWDSSTVYTIILDKSISDYRGNSLDQPLQFSFTCGSYMPENMIVGSVDGLKPNSTAVICISRKTSYPDSIILTPEYYTQSGPDGAFVFEHLPEEVFHIAGYVDIDKSNNYNVKFDGVCVPSQAWIVPDTMFSQLIFEAIYDNYLPGKLLKAENIHPDETKLTFTKDIAYWNDVENFRINSLLPDTLILNNNICTLYHHEIDADSMTLELTSLLDRVDIPLPDSTLKVPITAWADSFFHFEMFGEQLRIYPQPGSEILKSTFRTSMDTSEIILNKIKPAFYQLPVTKEVQHGTGLFQIPYVNARMSSDSLYSVPLQLKPKADHGAVMGLLETEVLEQLRLVLHNNELVLETAVSGVEFLIDGVSPGEYSLSYYVDVNGNGRRDPGRPYPYIKPEILISLDTEILVRARWDTELEEAYKIVVENDR